MGSSILANALARIDKDHGGPLFDGACILQCPLNLTVCYETLSSTLFGLYDQFNAQHFSQVLLNHEYALKDEVKKVCNVDLR